MSYYQVWVRSNRYHGQEALTYSGPAGLKPGQIVKVELNHQIVNGYIRSQSSKPSFKTKAIDTFYQLPTLPAPTLELMDWLKEYYPAPLGLITQQVLPSGNLDQAVDQPPSIKPILNDLPALSVEQKQALRQIKGPGSYLLHGITGSGKTRLYIEQAVKEFKQGRSSIILTPEISLTPQLGASFKAVFGHSVLIMHSKQTPKQRLMAWLRCLQSTRPLVVVGPRSALFAPLGNIGLVVLDEAHETAYKQQQSPQYQTSRVAAKLAELSRASLIMGSATPLVSDYYLARELGRPILKLTKLARQTKHHPTIKLIDRRDRSLFSRSTHLSDQLIEAIKDSLAEGSQVLLYLNRRGTARLVLCSNCGWQALCPNCHTPLTYHGDAHQLRCHSCGYLSLVPSSCPSCDHTDLIFQTAGTKAIADEVKQLFPAAKVARFDSDNLASERFEGHYQDVKEGKIDIIIGTQLLAKGLDLPNLNLVGVVLADTSLYLPDYTANERSFQLLTQVLGRIGRGHRAGVAIVQTYAPDHPAIKNALIGDYQSFYEREIADRQEFLFPPFCFLLKLVVQRARAETAEDAASQLMADLTSRFPVKVLGPAPAFLGYRAGKHHWQLVVKAKRRAELTKIVTQLPSGWSYDLDPVDLL